MTDGYSQFTVLLLGSFDWVQHGTFLLRCILLAWMTFMGAFVGSFMNVVVYRLPAGLNLAHPGSRCPNCLHPIRAYDNVPVLSWLALRGKCRDCAIPISARYPAVEALMATLFFAVSAVAIWTHPAIIQATKVENDVWQLVTCAVVPLVCWLLVACTLVCAALMEFDRQTIPIRLFWPAVVVGILASLVVSLVPMAHLGADGSARFVSVVGALMGAGWGGVLLVSYVVPGELRVASDGDSTEWLSPIGRLMAPRIAALAACGALLGWQVVTILTVIVTGCHVINRCLSCAAGSRSRDTRWFAFCAGGAAMLMLVWQALFAEHSWLGNQAGFGMLIFALPLVVGATLLAWKITGPETLPDPRPQTEGTNTMSQHDELRQAILDSPSYRLAESDVEFIQRPELRPICMQLELLKPEMLLTEQGVHSTIVVFGGTQIVEREQADRQLSAAQARLAADPANSQLQREVNRQQSIVEKSGYYDEAREFSRLVSSQCQLDDRCDHVVVTGGGPGIMEAANRGAADVGAKSIGLNITLPEEQAPNPYITPELCFQFHYFAMRKFHFLLRAQALVVFPGGFGTLDELFNTLTLRQTNRMQRIPIILYGTEYWQRIVNFQQLADEGVVQDEHLNLMQFADTPQDAWDIICQFESEPEEE